MPTENALSRTASAPSHTIATRSMPKTSPFAERNASPSFCVATSWLVASTTRLSQRERRSSWRPKSLIDCTPRTVSRKWLCCFAECTMCSSVARLSGS